MSSSPQQTVVFPFDLGEASRFDREIFPLLHTKRNNLSQSDLYLDATLDEMVKIINIGDDPQQRMGLISTTKASYDRLMLKKLELEQRSKTRNPFKAFANYRAARIFLAASQSLYFSTKTRTEEMRRTVGRGLVSVAAEEVEPVEYDLPPSASIKGVAVRLDRPLDDTTRQQLGNAANTIASYSGPYEDDQSISEASTILSDEYFLASESLTSLVNDAVEETSDSSNVPTQSSPTIITNYYIFYGSVYSPNSNVYGATVQPGGSQNSGSVFHTTTPPN